MINYPSTGNGRPTTSTCSRENEPSKGKEQGMEGGLSTGMLLRATISHLAVYGVTIVASIDGYNTHVQRILLV